MRDINRLSNIYNKLLEAHKEFPDLRFMQFMDCFFTWHKATYKNDGFYIEDSTFLKRFDEFMNKMKGVENNA